MVTLWKAPDTQDNLLLSPLDKGSMRRRQVKHHRKDTSREFAMLTQTLSKPDEAMDMEAWLIVLSSVVLQQRIKFMEVTQLSLVMQGSPIISTHRSLMRTRAGLVMQSLGMTSTHASLNRVIQSLSPTRSLI
uniref:Uncharacterized protein n=1 Tax=Branchiostoma floridae TaxID=7739 RepID=C3YPE4_BRAFL|eukprot:XP_002601716.1 hypothetical protein BRAFLDRAFT_76065 [Branchiostoma floridae]